MTYTEIVNQVAETYGFTPRFVDRVYKGYWKAIRTHITSLPLKEDLTDEEFLALQPNVNIPSLGKLYVSLDRYKKLKEHYNKTVK
jgi:hypothetical protein